MGSFKVNIMVSQILTKNSFKSGNGLVISPLLRDFLNGRCIMKNVDVHLPTSLAGYNRCNDAFLAIFN